MCVCVYLQAHMVHVWRSDVNLRSWFFPSSTWVPQVELGLIVLASSPFAAAPFCQPGTAILKRKWLFSKYMAVLGQYAENTMKMC